jgi:hypothetical protein
MQFRDGKIAHMTKFGIRVSRLSGLAGRSWLPDREFPTREKESARFGSSPGGSQRKEPRSGFLQSGHFVAAERRTVGVRSAMRTFASVPGDGRAGLFVVNSYLRDGSPEEHAALISLENIRRVLAHRTRVKPHGPGF